jgi:hypothetical protein
VRDVMRTPALSVTADIPVAEAALDAGGEVLPITDEEPISPALLDRAALLRWAADIPETLRWTCYNALSRTGD